MAEKYTHKRGDTGTFGPETLRDRDGQPADLTDAAVRLIVVDETGTVVVDAAADIVDPDAGRVDYDRQPADTADVYSGQAEWEVTYANGDVQTFPTQGHVGWHVVPDLG